VKIRNIPGNIPDPEELYGRDDLLKHLWRQLSGNNILLLAPRRFGKSGVMRHVLLRPHSGYLPIYFDLEDVETPQDFVWEMTRSLLRESKLRTILKAARSLPGMVMEWCQDTFDEAGFEGAKIKFRKHMGEAWPDAARRLLLEMEKAGPTVIFIFDELPAMLENFCAGEGTGTAGGFLAWFRTVRLEQKDALRRHRFIVGGSIGLDLILRRLKAPDKLNDFERIYVGPLDPDAARSLVRDLAASLEIGLGEGEVGQILDKVGPPVPYFIHLFFSQLAQLPRDLRNPLSAESIGRIYRERLLGPTCKHYFDHYRQRLARYGKGRERASLAILRAVAEAPRGRLGWSDVYAIYDAIRGRSSSETEFLDLLGDLECDWYLVLDPATNEFSFNLDLMRDWWLRWYGSPSRRKAGSGIP
jgi:hypothetical protein